MDLENRTNLRHLHDILDQEYHINLDNDGNPAGISYKVGDIFDLEDLEEEYEFLDQKYKDILAHKTVSKGDIENFRRMVEDFSTRVQQIYDHNTK